MKMYIAVLDEFPDYMTPTLVGHCVLGAHFKFCEIEDYKGWCEYPFKKVVVKVNPKEFAKIKSLDNVYVAHERNTLEGKDSCIAVCPRLEIPKVLKFAKLWKPDVVCGAAG